MVEYWQTFSWVTSVPQLLLHQIRNSLWKRLSWQNNDLFNNACAFTVSLIQWVIQILLFKDWCSYPGSWVLTLKGSRSFEIFEMYSIVLGIDIKMQPFINASLLLYIVQSPGYWQAGIEKAVEISTLYIVIVLCAPPSKNDAPPSI